MVAWVPPESEPLMQYDDFAYYLTTLHDAFSYFQRFPESPLLPGFACLYEALVCLLETVCDDREGWIRHYMVELGFGLLSEPELAEPTNLTELYNKLFPS